MPAKKKNQPLMLAPREISALKILTEGGTLLEERSSKTGRILPQRKSFYRVKPAKGQGVSFELTQGEGNRLIANKLVAPALGQADEFTPTRVITEAGRQALEARQANG